MNNALNLLKADSTETHNLNYDDKYCDRRAILRHFNTAEFTITRGIASDVSENSFR